MMDDNRKDRAAGSVEDMEDSLSMRAEARSLLLRNKDGEREEQEAGSEAAKRKKSGLLHGVDWMAWLPRFYAMAGALVSVALGLRYQSFPYAIGSAAVFAFVLALAYVLKKWIFVESPDEFVVDMQGKAKSVAKAVWEGRIEQPKPAAKGGGRRYGAAPVPEAQDGEGTAKSQVDEQMH